MILNYSVAEAEKRRGVSKFVLMGEPKKANEFWKFSQNLRTLVLTSCVFKKGF